MTQSLQANPKPVAEHQAPEDKGAFLIFFRQFQDFVAPVLDVYEQAVYLFICRMTIVEGKNEAVIGFKSARSRLAFGIGRAGSPPSEASVYNRLRSLSEKHLIEVLSSERTGTRIRVVPLAEIPGLIPNDTICPVPTNSVEVTDYFSDPQGRLSIFRRENAKCFYCLRALNDQNFVAEHVF